MACVYNYKGHKFDSEIDLDNYLISKLKFESKFGDLVFELGQRQMLEKLKLDKLLQQNKALWDEYLDLRKKGKIYYDEDGDPYIKEEDSRLIRYMGVNAFLAQLHQDLNISAKLLFPYFDDKNYFNERRKDWALGLFKDDEKQLWFGDEEVTNLVDPDDQNKLIDKIKAKWDAQGRSGDIIHAIFEEFFTDDNRYLDFDKLVDHMETKFASDANFKRLEYNGNVKDNIRSIVTAALKIYNDIKSEFNSADGKDLIFSPEFIVTGTSTDTTMKKDVDLFGKIDLHVIDQKGRHHIYDYKTSIKSYDHFDKTKRSGYSYLLAMYRLMLENSGLSTRDAKLHIIPVEIKGFESTSDDKFQFNGVVYDSILDIDKNPETDKAMLQVLDYFMPSKYITNITGSDVYKSVSDFSSKIQPDLKIEKAIDAESVKADLMRKKIFDKKNDNDEYEFSYTDPTQKGRKTVTAKTQDELINQVVQIRLNMLSKRLNLFARMKDAVKEALDAKNPDVDFPRTFINREGSSTWTKETLTPYCNGEWEIVDNIDDLEALGILTLKNSNTGLYDFIRISTNMLDKNINESLKDDNIRKKRTTILSNFESDAQAEQKYKRLALKGTFGNIELMEMMAAINALEGLDDGIVGNIIVMNPYDAKAMTASNELLLMNFNTLCKHIKLEHNAFDDGKIKLASKYDLLKMLLDELYTVRESLDNGWNGEYYKLKKCISCKDNIDAAIDGSLDEKIKAVLELLVSLQESFGDEILQDYSDLMRLNLDKIRLYNSVLFTLAELKGINFRLQTSDHNKWFSSIWETLKGKGLAGNMIDNPGNLDSETLNLITTLVKEAFLNTRDDIQREKTKLDKIIKKLKSDLGFDYLKENIGFNQVDLYKPLYREEHGDLLFKTVDQLKSENRYEYIPLLEYMLETINSRRLPARGYNASLIEDLKNNGSDDYYRVPLALGGFDSAVSSKGLLRALKEKLKYFNPKNWAEIYDKLERKLQGLGYQSKKSLIYKMENMFDRGEGAGRMEAIQQAGGLDSLERNAETLVLKHIFAYSQLKNINNVFPLIQAAAAHLSVLGAIAGELFKSDKNYLELYIRNKVLNENIVDPNLQGVTKYINVVKSAASKLTLAFTPVQMLYLPLLGLWTDISLIIRKPDGKLSFTFSHFKNAVKLVYNDLFNYSGKPTLCSKLNEWYALNDMDISKYIDNITHNKKGVLYNFTNMAYKFASRPDYYNRLSIFLSLMQGDGCLEAHSIVDGQLQYDWTKDKRFSKFAANPKSNSMDPEFLRLKSLYIAMARLFMNEHTKDKNGDDFVLDLNDPKPLPKAYTSKQADSMKAVADDIYGYYSTENKSLIQSTAFGAMWLLFKTFWSGKKNQYLQSGGIRMKGSWEPYVEYEKDADGNIIKDENGIPKKIEYYYGIKDNGDIDFEKIVKKEELPPEKQLAPVTYWKGQWQEGIAVTMAKLVKKGNIIRNYNELLKEDPDMARCYRSNIQQLAYDMFLWLIGGALLGGILSDWLKDLLEENKDNDDFLTGCKIAAANVAVWTVRNSFADFNMFESIGSPLVNWTPFAILWTSRSIDNLAKYATGDLDLWDTIVKTNGGMKQIKPIFDAIKPERYRTKTEGGTWLSTTAIRNQENVQ